MPAKIKSTDANNIIGPSFLIDSFCTGSGSIKAVTPKIKPMLAMLDPITLPSAISELPCMAALRLTINSGAEVPKAITVIPITKGDIFNRSARLTPPFTK